MWVIDRFRAAFRSFGYTTDSKEIDYRGNEEKVRDELRKGYPIFIYGFPTVGKKKKGHCWVLDGYMRKISQKYYINYYFDENANFNSQKSGTITTSHHAYVHANMGWGNNEEWIVWVNTGVYKFAEDYYEILKFLKGIKPNK